jgi:ATP-dependent DNA ligase
MAALISAPNGQRAERQHCQIIELAWAAPCQTEGIRLSEHLDSADGATVFHHACKFGLEGIVAKRRDKPYRSGRTAEWVKIKNPNAPAATRILEW